MLTQVYPPAPKQAYFKYEKMEVKQNTKLPHELDTSL